MGNSRLSVYINENSMKLLDKYFKTLSNKRKSKKPRASGGMRGRRKILENNPSRSSPPQFVLTLGKWPDA